MERAAFRPFQGDTVEWRGLVPTSLSLEKFLFLDFV